MARLGIHTRVKNIKLPGKTHAWITFVDGEDRQDYALYPNHEDYKDHKRLNENSDISLNAHDKDQPTSSLYVELSAKQEANFRSWLETQIEQTYAWRSNNCTHWARDAWEAGTGQRLEVESSMPTVVSDKQITVSSPVGLEKSIRELELQPWQERDISPNAVENFNFPAPAPTPDIEPDRATLLAQAKAELRQAFGRYKDKDCEREY